MAPLAAMVLAPCFVLPLPIEDVADRPAAPTDAYVLVYKFKKDQPVHYMVTQHTTRDSRQGPQAQIIRERIHEKKHLAVVEVRSDGSFVLKTVFDQVQMHADLSGKKVSFDSSKPRQEDPPGFGHFRDSISRPRFHVHFAANGKLLGVKRLSTAKGADGKSAGKSGDGSSYLVVFPKQPIEVGETWKEEYVVKIPMSRDITRSITILRTYRLNSVKDGLAKITFASSLKTPVRSPEILAKLIQAAPSGTVEFDIEAGQIVRRSMRVDETVLNHSGPQSMLQTVSRRLEKRVASQAESEVKVADTED